MCQDSLLWLFLDLKMLWNVNSQMGTLCGCPGTYGSPSNYFSTRSVEHPLEASRKWIFKVTKARFNSTVHFVTWTWNDSPLTERKNEVLRKCPFLKNFKAKTNISDNSWSLFVIMLVILKNSVAWNSAWNPLIYPIGIFELKIPIPVCLQKMKNSEHSV